MAKKQNSKGETSQKKASLQAPKKNPEDPKKLAYTLLQEGKEVDAIVASTGLNKAQVLGLKGALIKAQKRLEAPLEAPSETQAPLDNPLENASQEPEGTSQTEQPYALPYRSPPNQLPGGYGMEGVKADSPSSTPSIPPGGIVLTPNHIATLRVGMTKPQLRNLDSLIGVATEEMRQQMQRNNGHNQGWPMYPYVGYGNELDHALAEAVRARTRDRTMKWLFTDEEPSKPRESPWDVALKIVQFGQAMKGETKSLPETIAEVQGVMEAIKSASPPNVSWTPEQTIMYQKTMSDINQAKAKAKEDATFKREILKTVRTGLERVAKNPQAQEIARSLAGRVQKKMEGNPNPNPQPQQMQNAFWCPECAKEGVKTLIDISFMPKVAICPRNPDHRFPRDLTEEEKMIEKQKEMQKQAEEQNKIKVVKTPTRETPTKKPKQKRTKEVKK